MPKAEGEDKARNRKEALNVRKRDLRGKNAT